MSRRVLVVDDHVGFRANVRSLLGSLPGEYEVVGEAGNATKALQSVETLRPEINAVAIAGREPDGACNTACCGSLDEATSSTHRSTKGPHREVKTNP